MRIPANRLLIVALLVPLASACSSAPAPDPAPAGGMTPAEIEAVYRARTDSARMRFTEDDVLFVTGMIHHHAQAIEMAGRVPERTSNPEIHRLAARVINAQHDEIASMQQWLRARAQPVPELHVTGEHVMVHGTPDMHMPGMLTPAQLQQLEQARGRDFDRLLLELMIQHHIGAITMVTELFATERGGQDEEVFRLASDVQVDQATEIARMRRMLAAMDNPGEGRS